jgi:hypothetical protein
MSVKTCTKCEDELPATAEYFPKRKDSKDGLRNECKVCKKNMDKIYTSSNKERMSKLSREWRLKNSDRANAICKKYRDNNKEKRRDICYKWNKNNPERFRINQKKAYTKRRRTLKGALNHRLSSAIYQSIRKNKGGRAWESLVGYTVNELINHLEPLFLNGMTLDKLLNGEIHIDHKRPIASFNFESPDDLEFKQCWSLENLQPLWAEDNIRKSDKWEQTI